MKDSQFPMTINYDIIADSNEVLPVTASLARALIINPYMIPGDFYKSLSDDELYSILDQMDEEEGEGQDGCVTEDVILITEMLVKAEGLASGDLDELLSRIKSTIMYFTLESLRRKNLVKIHYHNMSYGEDCSHLKVAERLTDEDF